MWVLTREAADNAALQEALQRKGVQALSVPCIERRLRPWPRVDADWVMLTSRTAAEALPISDRAAVACLAPRTAEALRLRGREATLTASGGAVALARALVSELRTGQRVLYAHSNLATNRGEHQEALALLREAGARVDAHVLYDIVTPNHLAEAWRALPDEPLSLFFASPSAVEHWWLEQLRAPKRIARVACLGASTAAAYLAVSERAGLPAARLLTTRDDLASQLALESP